MQFGQQPRYLELRDFEERNDLLNLVNVDIFLCAKNVNL
jgi:hypothetical protein